MQDYTDLQIYKAIGKSVKQSLIEERDIRPEECNPVIELVSTDIPKLVPKARYILNMTIDPTIEDPTNDKNQDLTGYLSYHVGLDTSKMSKKDIQRKSELLKKACSVIMQRVLKLTK